MISQSFVSPLPFFPPRNRGCLQKCDYVLALEFLQVLMLKKEGKTADNMAKFGQAKYLLGDYEKAEEMCAGAIDLDAGHAAARGCLLTWDFDKWGPRLDKAAAAAQKARLAAEARAVREARAERLGRKLADHRRDLQRANVLDVWWQVWSRHYAATEIARCAKGAAARRQSARLLAEAKDLRLRTKAVVWAINSHLMRDVIQGWHVEWVRAAQERKVMSAHFKRKLELQVLRAFVREWAKRARMQVFGRTAAKRAMRGFRKLAMHSAQIAPADVDGDEDEEVGDSAAGKDAQQEGGGGVGGGEGNSGANKAALALDKTQRFYAAPLVVLSGVSDRQQRRAQEVLVRRALEAKARDAAVAAEQEAAFAAVRKEQEEAKADRKAVRKKAKPGSGSPQKVAPSPGEPGT